MLILTICLHFKTETLDISANATELELGEVK